MSAAGAHDTGLTLTADELSMSVRSGPTIGGAQNWAFSPGCCRGQKR